MSKGKEYKGKTRTRKTKKKVKIEHKPEEFIEVVALPGELIEVPSFPYRVEQAIYGNGLIKGFFALMFKVCLGSAIIFSFISYFS